MNEWYDNHSGCFLRKSCVRPSKEFHTKKKSKAVGPCRSSSILSPLHCNPPGFFSKKVYFLKNPDSRTTLLPKGEQVSRLSLCFFRWQLEDCIAPSAHIRSFISKDAKRPVGGAETLPQTTLLDFRWARSLWNFRALFFSQRCQTPAILHPWPRSCTWSPGSWDYHEEYTLWDEFQSIIVTRPSCQSCLETTRCVQRPAVPLRPFTEHFLT